VSRARLGRAQNLDALRRLDGHARRLEGDTRGPASEAHLENGRASAPALGARTVRDR
jgi:uncharacterized protein